MASTRLNVLNPVGSMYDTKHHCEQSQQNDENVSGWESGKICTTSAFSEAQHSTMDKDVQTSEKHVWDATTQTSLNAEAEDDEEQHQESLSNNGVFIHRIDENENFYNTSIQTLTKITESDNQQNVPFANNVKYRNNESNVADMCTQGTQLQTEQEQNASKKTIAVNNRTKDTADNSRDASHLSRSHHAAAYIEQENNQVSQYHKEADGLINEESVHDANQQHMCKNLQLTSHPTAFNNTKQSVMIDTDNTKTLPSERINITSSDTKARLHDCNEHLLNELKEDWEQNRSKTIRDATPALSLHRESISARSFNATWQNMLSTNERNIVNEGFENEEINDDVEISYAGPGPALLYNWSVVHKCFKKGNGLLFRLEDHVHHIWGFYNDTDNYLMKVKATFGHESMVEPLHNTEQIMHDVNSGYCTLIADIECHQTILFMRGEYNGFSLHYDAIPIYRCQHRDSKTDEYKEQEHFTLHDAA